MSGGKKKIYSICMYEKIHGKLARFAKRAKYKSLSEFLAVIGLAEIDKAKKAKEEAKTDGV